MGKLRTSAFVLLSLLVPVSCQIEVFFSNPTICYFLDGILIIYCIVATVLFFREKYSYAPSVNAEVFENNGGIYQELERPVDADPYQVLEPSKKKKKTGKKKKSEVQPTRRDADPYESLVVSSPPPPPR